MCFTGCVLHKIYKDHDDNDNVTNFHMQRTHDINSNNKDKKKINRLEYVRNQFKIKNESDSSTTNLLES